MSNRRSFLKLSTLGAIGSAIGASAAPSALARALPKKIADQPGVQLAIATICCDGFGDEFFEPAFRIAPAAGFRNIEFNCWYPRTLTPAGLRSIQERCRERQLRPISVQGNGFRDGKAIDVAHKLLCMQAAVTLGCSRVKFTGAKRGTNGGLPAIISTLKELAPAAEEMGILICVENHANNNLENVADYETLFAAIDSPNVGLCLDTGHFTGAAVSIPEIIERFHSRINHVDLKDCQSEGVYKTVKFGEGVTDLHGTIQELIRRGYQGYLVVEQAPPIEPGTLVQDLANAYNQFKQYQSPARA